MTLTLTNAEAAITRGKQQAATINVPMNIVVVDSGGHLKAFARMDGAVLGSIEIAQRKAKTAILFEMNSEAVFEFCKPGAPAFGLEQTNGGLTVFAGGIPLRDSEGKVIGAVGVSGGTVPQDFIVAQAAAAAFPTTSDKGGQEAK
jgi:uncharacterized protein GlcG (DUF336 family)